MALKFDVQFRGEFSSKAINDKFAVLFNKNAIISGFGTTIVSGMKVRLAPGIVVINGAFITETTDSRDFTLPLTTTGDKTGYLIAEYNHELATCLFSYSTDASVLTNVNMVVFCTIITRNNASSIVQGDITKSPLFTIANGDTGSSVAIGTIAPASPNIGDMWIDIN